MPRPTMTHVPQLDGLRATAILFVFVAHCGLGGVVPGGLGVTIFFFLSGYLITSLLRSEAAQTGRIDLLGFYIRRTLRIWPPLYITMALLLAVALSMPAGRAIDPWAVMGQLAFVSNYSYLWGHADGVPAIPLWSLAVEEHFYLVFPFLFAGLLARRRPRDGAILCAAACVAVLLLRLWLFPQLPDPELIYYLSHTRIDSILFGCILALWQNPVLDEAAWRPRAWQVWAAIGILVFCLVPRGEEFRQVWRYSLQGAALFVLFSAALVAEGWVGRLLASRPLRLVALYSYTLYLVHMGVLDLLMPDRSIPFRLIAGGGLAMAYAAAMHHLVERPLARWRRSLHKVDRAAVAVSA